MQRSTAKLYRIFNVIYFIFCALMTVVYAARRDIYHFAISAGTLVVPFALSLTYRLLHFKRSSGLDLLIMGFVTLAYPLGSCLDLYRRIPGFDKFAHGLSGVFVTILCIILFIVLKPDHKLTAADIPLAIVFSSFGSMAVAGMWEAGEYIVSQIVRLDLQRVVSTGVADSMNDILICMVGTLAALPIVPALARGRNGMLTDSIREFVMLNTKN